MQNFTKEDSKTAQNKHILCNICGASLYFSNMARHKRCQRHLQVNYINNEIFEIKRMKDKPKDEREILIIK